MYVSIIVPVYNVESKMKKCLESIIHQTINTDGQIEVILVDDGSTDRSGEICDRYANEYYFFKVIHQENGGAAAARNSGIEHAKGEYIAFVDPDDYIEPDYCEKAYNNAVLNGADIVIFDAIREEIDKHGEVRKIDWGHASTEFITQDGEDIIKLRCRILYPYYEALVSGSKLECNIPLSAPWDKLYKRDFLERNELKFPEQLKVLDDMCFNFKAFAKAEKISYIREKLYHYIIWKDSITNSFKKDRPLYDKKVFEYIRNEIDSDNLTKNQKTALYQAFYARVIKSFAICCRLYFFNSKNPDNSQKRLQEVKEYMKAAPYNDAFYNIQFRILEWKLWLVTLAGRVKCPRMLWLLHVMQNRKS